jgi:hypothetical protein
MTDLWARDGTAAPMRAADDMGIERDGLPISGADVPWFLENHMGLRKASPADLLAAVRAAVEDGTIEGEVVDLRYSDDAARLSRRAVQGRDIYLIIPVSDGGSET